MSCFWYFIFYVNIATHVSTINYHEFFRDWLRWGWVLFFLTFLGVWTDAMSHWNVLYKAFYRVFLCGNEIIG